MSKNLSVSQLCLVLLLLGSAVTSQAASMISFTSNLTEGDITTTGLGSTAAPVTVLDGDFAFLTISGALTDNGTYGTVAIPLFLPLAYTPDTLTITGAVPGLSGLAASTTLLTINFSAAGLTGNTTGTGANAFVLNSGEAISSIVVFPTLLADLGLTGTSFSLTSFTDTGAAQGTGLNSFTSSDPSLTLTSAPTAAPEPGSLLTMLFGLTSLAIGCVVRKKLSA